MLVGRPRPPPPGSDRWHLMENASAAFLDVVRRMMTVIRRAVGTTVVDPALLTCAERIQYDGYLRRRQTDVAIGKLARNGLGIKAIGRRLGCSRKMIRQVLRGGRSDVFRCRTSSLEPWLQQLDHEWIAGCRNAAEIWRRLQARGFPGSLRAVGEWATRRRRSEGAATVGLDRAPSARRLARLMTSARSQLARADALLIATAGDSAAIPGEGA